MPPSPPPSPAHLRALYRALLRELPPRPAARTAAPSPLQARLRAPFAAAAAPEGNDRAVAEAEQLVVYLRSQRQYVTLLERYNPGMGMDEEERVRLSARRSGMEMPVLHDPGAAGK